MAFSQNIVLTVAEVFEQYVRFNFQDDAHIRRLVLRQNMEERLKSLSEIASVGKTLIDSRIAGNYCRSANCGGLASFLVRILENVRVKAGEGSQDLADLGFQLATADLEAVHNEQQMEKQVAGLLFERIFCHLLYLLVLGALFWVVFITKNTPSKKDGGRGEDLRSFGENFAPTVYSGCLHYVERSVAKKGECLKEILVTWVWMRKVARVTASVIRDCSPPSSSGPPPPPPPPLPGSHRPLLPIAPPSVTAGSTPLPTAPNLPSPPDITTHGSFGPPPPPAGNTTSGSSHPLLHNAPSSSVSTPSVTTGRSPPRRAATHLSRQRPSPTRQLAPFRF